ncbi:hypothetical protein G6F54_013646 [Rhizopus delemar]|nr:hypothetical protein G6F54_013646 [Rhizopus delemar]
MGVLRGAGPTARAHTRHAGIHPQLLSGALAQRRHQHGGPGGRGTGRHRPGGQDRPGLSAGTADLAGHGRHGHPEALVRGAARQHQ